MLRLVIIAACAATVQAACDAIEVAGTDSDISTGSFDGLYDQAGACNGQPYYKCTCCTDYDQFLIDKCATPGDGRRLRRVVRDSLHERQPQRRLAPLPLVLVR